MLKKAIKNIGITHIELGRRVGVSPRAIGQYINNECKPRAPVIKAICKELFLDPRDLLPLSYAKALGNIKELQQEIYDLEDYIRKMPMNDLLKN